MGWLFSPSWFSKKEIIRHLTAEQTDHDTIAKCVRGSTLWVVYQHKATKERCIIGHLLGADKQHGWGYKDVGEEMGPCDISCPVSYFQLVPNPPNEYAKEWRAKVEAQHKLRSRKIKVGDTIILKAGFKPAMVKVTSVKPLRGYALVDYVGTFRIPRRCIADVQSGAQS